MMIAEKLVKGIRKDFTNMVFGRFCPNAKRQNGGAGNTIKRAFPRRFQPGFEKLTRTLSIVTK